MRSISEYLALPYTYILKQESDGSYFISVKELPGCMSVGEDVIEAHEMIKDAMQAWIEYCLEKGKPIPEPEEEIDEYSGRFVVRISPTLHKALAEGAKKNGVSMNHYTSELLAKRCSHVESLEKFNSELLEAITCSHPYLNGYLQPEGQYEANIELPSNKWQQNTDKILEFPTKPKTKERKRN